DPSGHVCNVGAEHPPGSDRQWIAVWPAAYNNNPAHLDDLYMIYDTGETPPGDDSAVRSTDGGHTWVDACDLCVRGNGTGSRPGPLIINKVTGTLYEFMGISNGFEVNISCDGGTTWSHVDQKGPDPQGRSTTNDFVVGAIDTAGSIYVAYAAS